MGIIVRNLSSNGLSNVRLGSNKDSTNTLDIEGFEHISNFNKDTNELSISGLDSVVNTVPLKNNTYYEIEHVRVGHGNYGISYGGLASGRYAMYGNSAPTTNMWVQTGMNSDSRFTNPVSRVSSNGDISGMLFRDMKIYVFINGILIHTFDDIKEDEEYYARFGNGASANSTRFRIITKDFVYRDISLAQV